MSRILGIDWGEKRIGLAVSDPLGIIATGLETVEKKPDFDLIGYLKQLIAEQEIAKIILGFPKNMDGSVGPKGEEVLAFKESLEKEINIPVILWDERLTTLSAQRSLREAEVKLKKGKKFLDKIAAVLILQNYLDHAQNKKVEG